MGRRLIPPLYKYMGAHIKRKQNNKKRERVNGTKGECEYNNRHAKNQDEQ